MDVGKPPAEKGACRKTDPSSAAANTVLDVCHVPAFAHHTLKRPPECRLHAVCQLHADQNEQDLLLISAKSKQRDYLL